MSEKLFQVYVNIRGMYLMRAKSEDEAKKLALEAARAGLVPDENEYCGDGVEYAVECDE